MRRRNVLLQFLILTMLFDTTTPINQCHTTVNFQKKSHNSALRHRQCRHLAQSTCDRYKYHPIRVAYFEMKPFTSTSLTDVSNRILSEIVDVALLECCGSCASVTYHLHGNHTHLTRRKMMNESDIRFPVFLQGNSRTNTFIPLIRLSGAVFIIKSAIQATTFGKAVFSAIMDIWPLLGLSLLLAYASGVIMWLVDTWSNKEHFPRRFLQGSFEGFWWSFISMTTVGYGDRSPKSLVAKLFAVFWILCGITIISLLTAALTTAIDSVTKALRPSFRHGNIGILRNHLFEKSILMKGNAKVKESSQLSELITQLHNNVIEGILLDSYTLKSFNKNLLVAKKLYIDQVIEDSSESYLGVSVDDPNLYDLINEYVMFQGDVIRDYVHLSAQSTMDEMLQPHMTANMIFTTKSGMFYPILIIGAVIVTSVVLVGVTYEMYYKRKMKNKVHQRNTFSLTPRNLRKQEEKLERELSEMLGRWDKEMLCLVDNYSLQGLFNSSNKTNPNTMVRLRTRNCSTGHFNDKPPPPQPRDNGGRRKMTRDHNVSMSELEEEEEDSSPTPYHRTVEKKRYSNFSVQTTELDTSLDNGISRRKRRTPTPPKKRNKHPIQRRVSESRGTQTRKTLIGLKKSGRSRMRAMTDPVRRPLPPIKQHQEIVVEEEVGGGHDSDYYQYQREYVGV